ncbi:SF0329 family protein [Ureibacillus sinduriensis]|uniref:Uncharacterized protein n=1 Tax=Ureibacillus sinduriensis BLB-1 = JCM 15800 TaxID=1384057 RepID=A0A0A3I5Y5_9BACL|nr:hypothetical protein [Ureibacillus sinduriensis]KGR78113.1 hypothetical protein CD33_01715 [Ureibacillus sinduriensis BLB-1 = JCM 15800]
MRFSKLKKSLEGFLCESLKKRVELHAAVYRQAHDSPSRVWLTFDKVQIFSAADLSFSVQHFNREQELVEQFELKPIPYNSDWEVMFLSPERKALIAASDQAEEELHRDRVWASWHLYASLLKYLNLSIEEALTSEYPLVRAFALFDRRVGKRRLLNMEHFTHSIEEKFFHIRCKVEGLNKTN